MKRYGASRVNAEPAPALVNVFRQHRPYLETRSWLSVGERSFPGLAAHMEHLLCLPHLVVGDAVLLAQVRQGETVGFSTISLADGFVERELGVIERLF